MIIYSSLCTDLSLLIRIWYGKCIRSSLHSPRNDKLSEWKQNFMLNKTTLRLKNSRNANIRISTRQHSKLLTKQRIPHKIIWKMYGKIRIMMRFVFRVIWMMDSTKRTQTNTPHVKHSIFEYLAFFAFRLF